MDFVGDKREMTKKQEADQYWNQFETERLAADQASSPAPHL
jgi:hypothetical protein